MRNYCDYVVDKRYDDDDDDDMGKVEGEQNALN